MFPTFREIRDTTVDYLARGFIPWRAKQTSYFHGRPALYLATASIAHAVPRDQISILWTHSDSRLAGWRRGGSLSMIRTAVAEDTAIRFAFGQAGLIIQEGGLDGR
jgi:hypothetical protein